MKTLRKIALPFGLPSSVQAMALAFVICHLSLAPAQAQRLSVNTQNVDCGRTGFEQPVTATFELKNKGLRRLVISQVKPDCGCTRVELSKKEAGPGDKLTLTVTYDARQLGHFDKSVAIYSNATKAPVYLKMHGVVLEDYQDYRGSYPFDFGGLMADINNLEFDDVHKGEKPQQELHIVNNTQQTLTPNVQHLPAYLTAEVSPEQLAPGRSGKVTLTLNSDLLKDFGLTQTNVHLAQQLGEKVKAESEVGVTVVLLPDLTKYEGDGRQRAPVLALSSRDMTLPPLGTKAKRQGDITLMNTGQSTLKITSLQMFTPGLRVTLGKRELLPGEQTKLKVTAFRDELRKARSKPRVLMITNDPDLSKVVININVEQ